MLSDSYIKLASYKIAFYILAYTFKCYSITIYVTDLRMLVKTYLDKCGRTVKQFTNNYPGDDWCLNFMSRHKDRVSHRLCQNISPKRAEVNPDGVKEYFKNLEQTLKDIPPCNIVNYDETNLSDDPGRKKCIFQRGSKYPERTMHSSKSSTSIMFAGSASGELLPMYVVYRAENLWDSWTYGGPPETRYNRSKSGWFDAQCFEDWFRSIAFPYLKRKEGTKVLIGDNLSSHFNQDVLDLCKNHDIKFACLPPNSTHICQPLDVAFFRPLKIKWRNILSSWKTNGGRRNAIVTKDKFPSLLKLLLESMKENCKSNLLSGFRKSGIAPFNPEEVLAVLPNVEEDAERVKSSVGEVFIEHLNHLRYGEQEKQQKGRRKKLSVEPGKSIGGADMTVSSGTDPQPCSSNTAPPTLDFSKGPKVQIGKKRPRESSSSEDDSDHESSLNLSDSEECNGEPESDEEIDMSDPKEGDYLLITYKFPKSTKNYVGKVEEVRDGCYSMMYMRMIPSSDRKFTFPRAADVDTITNEQILLKLKQPTITRGVFDFNMSFRGMFVQ